MDGLWRGMPVTIKRKMRGWVVITFDKSCVQFKAGQTVCLTDANIITRTPVIKRHPVLVAGTRKAI